jgi:hypothetical protein
VLVVVPAERRDAVAALESQPVERDGHLVNDDDLPKRQAMSGGL